MAEAAKKIVNLRPPEQIIDQTKASEPWLRQKGEPALWFSRFNLYIDLGPKRSLRAAIAADPASQKATKAGPEKKLSDVSVPGAWRRAAQLWRWKERAEAFELHRQDIYAQFIRKSANECQYASKAYRIMELNMLAKNLRAQIREGMTLKELIKISAQLQSVMRDMAAETKDFDNDGTLDARDSSAFKKMYAHDIEEQYKGKLKHAMPIERNQIILEKQAALDAIK